MKLCCTVLSFIFPTHNSRNIFPFVTILVQKTANFLSSASYHLFLDDEKRANGKDHHPNLCLDLSRSSGIGMDACVEVPHLAHETIAVDVHAASTQWQSINGSTLLYMKKDMV